MKEWTKQDTAALADYIYKQAQLSPQPKQLPLLRKALQQLNKQ